MDTDKTKVQGNSTLTSDPDAYFDEDLDASEDLDLSFLDDDTEESPVEDMTELK